jgi:TatD DNase family protein
VIDTHCHLDIDAFDADRDAVLARAAAAGVRGILVPSIRPRTWATLVTYATRHHTKPAIRIALGIHPQVVPELDASELADDPVAGICASVTSARTVVVAVGECGLDGATGERDRQELLFRAHIRAARELGLPLVIHVLRAHDIAPRILREEQALDVGGVLHSYSGSADLIDVYAKLGMRFSFAGPVTFAGAHKRLAAVRAVPAELLLAETDAPDQSPATNRGRRNEPAFVAEVIAGLATARGTSVTDMRALTTVNATRLFGDFAVDSSAG